MGLDTSQLDSALGTTQRMMFILGLAVVLAVSVALYIFNKLIAKNILLATRALRLLGKGQLETRISKSRSDEFGDLFNSFNSMADSLEQRIDSLPTTPEHTDDISAHPLDDTAIDVSGITHASVNDLTMVQAAEDDDKQQ